MEHLLFSILYYGSLRVLCSHGVVTVKFHTPYSTLTERQYKYVTASSAFSPWQLSTLVPKRSCASAPHGYLLKAQNP